MSGATEHVLGNVSFGPAQTLWEEQPSFRELYDQACAGLVRLECENDELRAEVAMLKQGMAIVALERDEALADYRRVYADFRNLEEASK
jgi:hypothetical protein